VRNKKVFGRVVGEERHVSDIWTMQLQHLSVPAKPP
jgi:hypothetical protein